MYLAHCRRKNLRFSQIMIIWGDEIFVDFCVPFPSHNWSLSLSKNWFEHTIPEILFTCPCNPNPHPTYNIKVIWIYGAVYSNWSRPDLQELHAHLNGSISAATMKKLLKRYAEKVSQSTEGERTAIPELWETAIAKGEKRTLDEYV